MRGFFAFFFVAGVLMALSGALMWLAMLAGRTVMERLLAAVDFGLGGLLTVVSGAALKLVTLWVGTSARRANPFASDSSADEARGG